MVRQLNVRVGEINYLIFETMQQDLKKEGMDYNQREMVEMMILKTYNDMQKATRAGISLREMLES